MSPGKYFKQLSIYCLSVFDTKADSIRYTLYLMQLFELVQVGSLVILNSAH